MNQITRNIEHYYPPPESQGGWRWLTGAEAIRERAGMDSATLDQVMQTQEWLSGGDSWGIVIIRHGYLVRGHRRYREDRSVVRLAGEPAAGWHYSDAPVAHVAVMFTYFLRRQMGDYLQGRILAPTGLAGFSCGVHGGSGSLGAVANARTG